MKKPVLLLEAKLDLKFAFFVTLTKTMAPAFTTTGKLPANVDADSTNMDMSDQVRDLCEQGRLREAFHILHMMDHQLPCTYAQIFQSCINMKALAQGKLAHAHIIQRASELDNYVQTKLLIMYAKSGKMRETRLVLDEMQEPNVVSWTAIIGAYAKHGFCQDAFIHFVEMQRAGVQPDQFTFATVLQVMLGTGFLMTPWSSFTECLNET